MATVRALFLLGHIFLSCSLIGASLSPRTHRSLIQIRTLNPTPTLTLNPNPTPTPIPIPNLTPTSTPNVGPAIFDVTKFGAVADDKTDNVDAFRAAWEAACKNSTTQAKVVIPAGTFHLAQTMFAGPCTSPKPITIEVIGTLKANTDPSEYVDPEWFTFQEIDGFVLTGKGVFDGQGAVNWHLNDCQKMKGNCVPLPSSVKFENVNNSVMTDITSLNSMMFHIHLHRVYNASVSNLNITAPGHSPNTDGVHISAGNNIKIFNSIIGTGDDCISIGHSTSNIAINNITCGPGHGISIGSLGKRPGEGSVNGVKVTNCTFINTTNGARIKTYIGKVSGEVKNVIYDGLIMNHVENPIVIDQNYGSKMKIEPSTSVWKISDTHFRNIKGTTISNTAVSLECSTQNPCEGVEVADIDLAYSGSRHNTTYVSFCVNANAIFRGILNPPVPSCVNANVTLGEILNSSISSSVNANVTLGGILNSPISSSVNANVTLGGILNPPVNPNVTLGGTLNPPISSSVNANATLGGTLNPLIPSCVNANVTLGGILNSSVSSCVNANATFGGILNSPGTTRNRTFN